ncbi:hypothetical protein PoB_003063800 [Plakobranchus ocellatus]|uniref:Uncharacterized protein n=1 Tax=Plakobranchus ocellatus TaxID=259542 RepID=A0AAV4AA75_9GAST|nr:hypothetical protein PoB_003063800 [Plakobranchus ocellatus]
MDTQRKSLLDGCDDYQFQLCADKTPQETLRVLPASKLMLKGILVKIQKQHTDPITQEIDQEVVETCESLESTLHDMLEKIETAKAAV